MSRKKHLLTMKNRNKIDSFLKKYLDEVFSDEEYITGFKKAYDEAYRVEVYGARRYLTPKLVTEWLQGLPVCVQYITYNIVCMLLNVVTGSSDYEQMKNYVEDAGALDSYYWNTLGRIIFNEALRQ